MNDNPVQTIPNHHPTKIDVLSKMFVQNILCHALQSLSFFYEFAVIIHYLLQLKGAVCDLSTLLEYLHIMYIPILGIFHSVSDPHKVSCGSGSRIPKMSFWNRIRIQTPNVLFGSGSKGGKN